MKLLLPEGPAFDTKPAKIDSWYDRRSRVWVVQTLNAAGDQLGDASYAGTKLGRDAEIAYRTAMLKVGRL